MIAAEPDEPAGGSHATRQISLGHFWLSLLCFLLPHLPALLLVLLAHEDVLLLAPACPLDLLLLRRPLQGRELGADGGRLAGLGRPGRDLELRGLDLDFLLLGTEPSSALALEHEFRLLPALVLELLLLELLGGLLERDEGDTGGGVGEDQLLDGDAGLQEGLGLLGAEDEDGLLGLLLVAGEGGEAEAALLLDLGLVLEDVLLGFLRGGGVTSSSSLLMAASVRLTKSVSCSSKLKILLPTTFLMSASLTTQLVITFFSSFFSMTIVDVSISFSSSLLACAFLLGLFAADSFWSLRGEGSTS
jgi:hypothetical protein